MRTSDYNIRRRRVKINIFIRQPNQNAEQSNYIRNILNKKIVQMKKYSSCVCAMYSISIHCYWNYIKRRHSENAATLHREEKKRAVKRRNIHCVCCTFSILIWNNNKKKVLQNPIYVSWGDIYCR